MSAEHDFFGLVDDDGAGGLSWTDTVELGDQAVTVSLAAADAGAVTDAALDVAAGIVRALVDHDAMARDALAAQLAERGSATVSYLDSQVDELGENLVDVLVYNSGDILVDVLRSLHLESVTFRPENTDPDDLFAVFEYSLDPDASDDVLEVGFDSTGDVVSIEIGE